MNRICNRYNKRFSLNAFIKDQIFITFTEETMDSANRKLKTSSWWSGLCLSLNFASFSSSGHVCDFDDTIRSTSCKRLMWWWKCALIYIYTKKCARASAQPRSRDLGICTNQHASLKLRARAIQNYCLSVDILNYINDTTRGR